MASVSVAGQRGGRADVAMSEKEAQFRATMEAAQVGIFVLAGSPFQVRQSFPARLVRLCERGLHRQAGAA
jgi:hypothetical protein